MQISELILTAGIPRIDAELLLARALGKSRTWVLAHDDELVGEKALTLFREKAARRIRGEPLAYLTGMQEFFGRSFAVNSSVLIPRPSTEGLIELALSFLREKKLRHVQLDTDIAGIAVPLRPGNCHQLVDIGCGSGCIAVTLALEVPSARIVAVDNSKDALLVARQNIAAYHLENRMETVERDGAEFIRSCREPFIVVANPPYIPEGTLLPASVSSFEPLKALFAGKGGLDVLLPIARAARDNPACLAVVLELREDQVQPVLKILT